MTYLFLFIIYWISLFVWGCTCARRVGGWVRVWERARVRACVKLSNCLVTIQTQKSIIIFKKNKRVNLRPTHFGKGKERNKTTSPSL